MTRLSLSDGSLLSQDYTAAAVIQDATRLQNLQTTLASYDQEKIQITKENLNSEYLDTSDETRPLSVTEFNAVMVTLVNSEAATEAKTTSGGYSQYTFTLHLQDAIRVLDQQVIATIALQQLQSAETPSTDVKLVATLPQSLRQGISADVSRLDIELRRMLMDASDTVRVANPYFDPDQWIIQDLASLPRRGIETKILTREATGESVADRTLEAVTALVSNLSSEEVGKVTIRDYYKTSQTGHQTGAVHAKVISVDDHQCYIGSANLTDLNLQGNFELGVVLKGDLVSEVNEVFDGIFSQADTVPI